MPLLTPGIVHLALHYNPGLTGSWNSFDWNATVPLLRVLRLTNVSMTPSSLPASECRRVRRSF